MLNLQLRQNRAMARIGINLSTGSLQKEEIIVGIDLGTTNSLVAIIHPETGKPIALREHDSSSLVPSILYFEGENQVLVGDRAKEHLVSDPQRTIFSVKRLMGKSYNDIRVNASFFTYKVIDDDAERLVKIQVGSRFYSPVELSSLILKELKGRAEHILKTPVNKAVITVPAYFNDAQRQATRDAGKLAGLDVLRIINEPTAASLAYGLGLEKNLDKKIAVYDLGGGTFDISILSISNGIFEVLSTNGDTYLGGDDLDHSVAEYILQKAGIDPKKREEDKNLAQELRLKAESIKKTLSETGKVEIKFAGKEFEISREIFDKLIKSYVDKTITCCAAAMKAAAGRFPATRPPKVLAHTGAGIASAWRCGLPTSNRPSSA